MSSRPNSPEPVSTSGGRGLDLKIILVGAANAGKTSIVVRFCRESFSSTTPTIGANFMMKRLLISKVHVNLGIWDTAGQERFRSMTPLYYRNAKAAIIVWDCSKPGNFENAKTWIEELRTKAGPKVKLFLVANKIDCDHKHVNFSEINTYAKEENVTCFRVSAKTGKGIEELFKDIAKILVAEEKQKLLIRRESISKNQKQWEREESRPAPLLFDKVDEALGSSFQVSSDSDSHGKCSC